MSDIAGLAADPGDAPLPGRRPQRRGRGQEGLPGRARLRAHARSSSSPKTMAEGHAAARRRARRVRRRAIARRASRRARRRRRPRPRRRTSTRRCAREQRRAMSAGMTPMLERRAARPPRRARSPPPRRLLELVLRQGAAIRARDVDGVLAAAGRDPDRDGPPRRASSRTAPRCSQRAGAALGVAARRGHARALCRAHGAAEAASAPASARAELRGLLAEIAREHGINRALMRQELAFLAHLTRLVGGEPEPRLPPPAGRPGAAAAPPRRRHPPRPGPPGLSHADLHLLRPPDLAARACSPSSARSTSRPQHRQRQHRGLHAPGGRARRRRRAAMPAGAGQHGARRAARHRRRRPGLPPHPRQLPRPPVPRPGHAASATQTAPRDALDQVELALAEPGDERHRRAARRVLGRLVATSPTRPRPGRPPGAASSRRSTLAAAFRRSDDQLTTVAAQAQRRVRPSLTGAGRRVSQIADRDRRAQRHDQARRRPAATSRTTCSTAATCCSTSSPTLGQVSVTDAAATASLAASTFGDADDTPLVDDTDRHLAADAHRARRPARRAARPRRRAGGPARLLPQPTSTRSPRRSPTRSTRCTTPAAPARLLHLRAPAPTACALDRRPSTRRHRASRRHRRGPGANDIALAIAAPARRRRRPGATAPSSPASAPTSARPTRQRGQRAGR